MNPPSSNLQFTSITISPDATLTVPSGLILRSIGNVEINGSIVVPPKPSPTAPGSELVLIAAGLTGATAYSPFQLSQLLRPGPFTCGSAPGGGGGGTLVILSAGSLTVNGAISANGGDGPPPAAPPNIYGYGGGGGGLLILTAGISLSINGPSSLSVNGGQGGDGGSFTLGMPPTTMTYTFPGGGGGGGGVINLISPNISPIAGAINLNGGAPGEPGGAVNEGGGYGGGGCGGNGGNGGNSTTGTPATPGAVGILIQTVVPNPATLAF
jgi:hypothetical protein